MHAIPPNVHHGMQNSNVSWGGLGTRLRVEHKIQLVASPTIVMPSPMVKFPRPSLSGFAYFKTLTTDEVRCYEAKIEESEKVGSCRESNPGHLWLERPVATESRQLDNH